MWPVAIASPTSTLYKLKSVPWQALDQAFLHTSSLKLPSHPVAVISPFYTYNI